MSTNMKVLFQIHVCHLHVHYIKTYSSLYITVPFLGHLISCRAHMSFHISPSLSPVHSLLLLCTTYVHSKSLPYLNNSFPLPRSIPLSLTVPRSQFRFPNSFFFFLNGDWLWACRPTPNLGGQSTIIVTPESGWPSCTPRHWVCIVVTFCNLHGLQRDCSFPQSLHGENQIPSLYSIILEVIQLSHYMCSLLCLLYTVTFQLSVQNINIT